MQAKEFILGKGNVPNWFNEQCDKGRAKINYDDDGKMLCATIHTPTKTIKAKIGDSIILAKSGLQVVSKEKAIKYRILKSEKVKENIEEDFGEVKETSEQ